MPDLQELDRPHKPRSTVYDRKTGVLAALVNQRLPRAPARILVVGCGNGIEAATLAQAFKARVTGIDIEERFDPDAASLAELRTGNAMQLDFAEGSFDFVYSYHALEHIADPRSALSEMRRVLVSDGHFCVGTPNRSRLIGYLGSKGASTLDKLRWNAADWKARLRNEFRNELGAHAGFTRGELSGLLRRVFSSVDDITPDYYSHLYSRHARMINALETTGAARVLLPSVYFFGRR